MIETDDWIPQKLDIDRTSYTIDEFHEWHRDKRLILSPDFQRGEVWKRPAKAFLIDTILRDFPIPPLHIRANNPGTGLIREVIDGQQRLTAVIQFLENDFALGKTPGIGYAVPPWAGMRFRELSPTLQRRVLDYSFRCEVYKGQVDDAIIREIFSRINTYSVPLNSQEIRNGRYFGLFKQAVYELAREHEKFWLAAGVFSQTSIARMLDAELVSEILVAEIAGQQDKKTMLNSFYHRFEEDWSQRDLFASRFREVTDVIRSSSGDILKTTSFRRPPLYYTLFCVVYHRIFGLDQRTPTDDNPLVDSPRRGLSPGAERRLAEALSFLTDVITGPLRDPAYEEFRKSASSQTDNIRPRLFRFRTLWKEAALSEV